MRRISLFLLLVLIALVVVALAQLGTEDTHRDSLPWSPYYKG